MKIDENAFYPNNFEDFVHKNVLQHLFKFVAETHISDVPNARAINSVTYQRDDNGEYRLLVSYVDENGYTQSKVLPPAITSRVIDLCNAEIVKHFLYTKNGQDVMINQMRFRNDKLELNLVDGDHIELDLKPLVPRINVIGPNGEVLQKNLNYHINDNKIVFVDLQGNDTTLDFNKLLTVEAFNEARQELQAAIDSKVNQTQYDTDKATMQNDIDSKESRVEHNQDVEHLQGQIDDRVTKEDYEAGQVEQDKKIDALPTKEYVDDADAKKLNITRYEDELEQLHQADNARVTKTEFNHSQADQDAKINELPTKSYVDKQLDTKVDNDAWHEVEHRQDSQIAALPTEAQVDQKIKDSEDKAAAAYVTKTSFEADQATQNDEINKRQTAEQVDAKINSAKSDIATDYVTKTDYNSGQAAQDEKINSKANASDVAADLAKRYTKEEIDAMLGLKANTADVDEKLNSKANASDVAADMNNRYTKEEVDALLTQNHIQVININTKEDLEKTYQNTLSVININPDIIMELCDITLSSFTAYKSTFIVSPNNYDCGIVMPESLNFILFMITLADGKIVTGYSDTFNIDRYTNQEIDDNFSQQDNMNASKYLSYDGNLGTADLHYMSQLNNVGPGIYQTANSFILPEITSGQLIVLPNENDNRYGVQIYFAASTGNMYYRVNIPSTGWSAWKKVTTSEDLSNFTYNKEAIDNKLGTKLNVNDGAKYAIPAHYSVILQDAAGTYPDMLQEALVDTAHNLLLERPLINISVYLTIQLLPSSNDLTYNHDQQKLVINQEGIRKVLSGHDITAYEFRAAGGTLMHITETADHQPFELNTQGKALYVNSDGYFAGVNTFLGNDAATVTIKENSWLYLPA